MTVCVLNLSNFVLLFLLFIFKSANLVISLYKSDDKLLINNYKRTAMINVINKLTEKHDISKLFLFFCFFFS